MNNYAEAEGKCGKEFLLKVPLLHNSSSVNACWHQLFPHVTHKYK